MATGRQPCEATEPQITRITEINRVIRAICGLERSYSCTGPKSFQTLIFTKVEGLLSRREKGRMLRFEASELFFHRLLSAAAASWGRIRLALCVPLSRLGHSVEGDGVLVLGSVPQYFQVDCGSGRH